MNQIQQEQYTGKGGIYSTRKLELACRKNIDFIWLLQGEKVPDYSSFARFRSGKAKEVFHKYDGKENLTRRKLRKLADRQVPDATFMRMKEDHMRNGQLKPA